MAIINVTGDDLFGRLGESAAPGDETLAKEIPLLLKQIEATAQETERATQLLKHALDLEYLQVTRPSFQARPPITVIKKLVHTTLVERPDCPITRCNTCLLIQFISIFA
jgi:hypothetical protein